MLSNNRNWAFDPFLMLGAQLWINLPAANKMVPPAYNGINAADVPHINESGALIKVVAGGGYFQKPYETFYPLKRALLLSNARNVNVKAGEEGVGFLLLTAKALDGAHSLGRPYRNEYAVRAEYGV